MRICRYFLLMFCLVLVGCDSILQEENLSEDISLEQERLTWDAKQYYQAAKTEFNAGKYNDALDGYQAIIGLFPNTSYARQSLVDMIYVNYFLQKWDQVEVLVKRFKLLFPNDVVNAYVMYMQGVSAHEKLKTIFDNLFELDQSGRDRSVLLKVYFIFKELAERFPNSEYAQDARQRMLQIHDFLAQSEFNVAMFYAQKKQYIAVINRIKYLIEHFPTSHLVADGLFLMGYYYNRLDLNDLSDDAESVLRLNYSKYNPNEQIRQLIEDDLSDRISGKSDAKLQQVFDQGILSFLNQPLAELNNENKPYQTHLPKPDLNSEYLVIKSNTKQKEEHKIKKDPFQEIKLDELTL